MKIATPLSTFLDIITTRKKKVKLKTFDSLIPPMILMILAASTGEDQAIHGHPPGHQRRQRQRQHVYSRAQQGLRSSRLTKASPTL